MVSKHIRYLDTDILVVKSLDINVLTESILISSKIYCSTNLLSRLCFT